VEQVQARQRRLQREAGVRAARALRERQAALQQPLTSPGPGSRDATTNLVSCFIQVLTNFRAASILEVQQTVVEIWVPG